eukprot:TRINITY_DN8267_c0_g1_i1.p1 TRINITY_DN8267_c0_g1~~TRINITY_DN8267_c0_g1_i1.p1  ORF type:complete len:857 (-),score=179.95 TRINITY_DN8267_c0_g1_i1:149-2719(-)
MARKGRPPFRGRRGGTRTTISQGSRDYIGSTDGGDGSENELHNQDLNEYSKTPAQKSSSTSGLKLTIKLPKTKLNSETTDNKEVQSRDILVSSTEKDMNLERESVKITIKKSYLNNHISINGKSSISLSDSPYTSSGSSSSSPNHESLTDLGDQAEDFPVLRDTDLNSDVDPEPSQNWVSSNDDDVLDQLTLEKMNYKDSTQNKETKHISTQIVASRSNGLWTEKDLLGLHDNFEKLNEDMTNYIKLNQEQNKTPNNRTTFKNHTSRQHMTQESNSPHSTIRGKKSFKRRPKISSDSEGNLSESETPIEEDTSSLLSPISSKRLTLTSSLERHPQRKVETPSTSPDNLPLVQPVSLEEEVDQEEHTSTREEDFNVGESLPQYEEYNDDEGLDYEEDSPSEIVNEDVDVESPPNRLKRPVLRSYHPEQQDEEEGEEFQEETEVEAEGEAEEEASVEEDGEEVVESDERRTLRGPGRRRAKSIKNSIGSRLKSIHKRVLRDKKQKEVGKKKRETPVTSFKNYNRPKSAIPFPSLNSTSADNDSNFQNEALIKTETEDQKFESSGPSIYSRKKRKKIQKSKDGGVESEEERAQQVANRFWEMVDPYYVPIKDDHLDMLRSLEEEPIDDPTIRSLDLYEVPTPSHHPSSQTTDGSTCNVMGSDTLRFGEVSQRLVSCFIDEKVVSKGNTGLDSGRSSSGSYHVRYGGGGAPNLSSSSFFHAIAHTQGGPAPWSIPPPKLLNSTSSVGGYGYSISLNSNNTDLFEDCLRSELGLIDLLPEEQKGLKEDDEVCAELRTLQTLLKDRSATNQKLREEISARAYERIEQQKSEARRQVQNQEAMQIFSQMKRAKKQPKDQCNEK